MAADASLLSGGSRRTPLAGREAAAAAPAVDGSVTFRNTWIASVDAAQRHLPGWAALAVACAALGLGLFGGAALYRVLPEIRGGYVAAVADRLVLYALVLGPLAATALGFSVLIEQRPRPLPTAPPALAAAAAVASGLLFWAALGGSALAGAVAAGAGSQAATLRSLGVVVGAVLVLLQAGGEELFFRGWLQPLLAARWGPWLGLVATALLFAASHAVLKPLSPLAFVNDVLAGLAFGLFALRTGGLAAPIAAHWAWNWTEQSLAGATPNPGVDPLGSLFDLDLVGPAWLGGGPDEMNGAVTTTVALLALAALAAWSPLRARRG